MHILNLHDDAGQSELRYEQTVAIEDIKPIASVCTSLNFITNPLISVDADTLQIN